MDLKCPNVLLADTRNQGVHKNLPVLVFLPISQRSKFVFSHVSPDLSDRFLHHHQCLKLYLCCSYLDRFLHNYMLTLSLLT